MKIGGHNFKYEDVFPSAIAIADSWVKASNKTGTAHGEAKLYIANKKSMHDFFGANGFATRCFMLRADLVSYMESVKHEYSSPILDYREKTDRAKLWNERMELIKKLPDFITFIVNDQSHIEGNRGYVNSNDDFYGIIREIALPFISFIKVMHLKDNSHDIYYWRLFADFVEMEQRMGYVDRYGSLNDIDNAPKSNKRDTKQVEYRQARKGQGKYREKLLEQCPFCPITMIGDEALLLASHIKPWSVCDDREKIDPKNGLILSPLYDKLFDRGFITFYDDKTVSISKWLSRQDSKRIGITEHQLFKFLPLDEQRINYLKYHQEVIYKGIRQTRR